MPFSPKSSLNEIHEAVLTVIQPSGWQRSLHFPRKVDAIQDSTLEPEIQQWPAQPVSKSILKPEVVDRNVKALGFDIVPGASGDEQRLAGFQGTGDAAGTA